MTQPTRIALLGFSRFERATFESFFRLAARREPSYAPAASPPEADFVVADADDAAACAEVDRLGLRQRTVMLGITPRPGTLLQLPRPINLMLVVRALDGLPRTPASTPAEPAPSKQVQRVLEQLAQHTRPADLDGPLPAAPAARAPRVVEPAPAPAAVAQAALAYVATMPAPLDPPLVAAGPGAPTATGIDRIRLDGDATDAAARLDHILVVDDSDIALRFMASNLQRFGFHIHLARSGTEAIERVRERHFEFVFLDVMMEGLDGFQTCKAIKRAPYAAGKRPPTVVMLTSRGTAVDKLRGTMAGADAYLTKPLRETELLKVIGDREIVQHGYADTAASNTLM